MKPFVITFACTPGSGKSTLAHYLSIELGMPIFSNDAIRDEVHQDQDLNPELDVAEFEKRRGERLSKLLKSKVSFLYDASVDRRWSELKKHLDDADYEAFIISYDLSKELNRRMYEASQNPIDSFESYYDQHQQFLKNHSIVISLSINDQTYPNRRDLSLQAFRKK